MKAVGKVSARSQTATPDQQIMKRRKPAAAASSNATRPTTRKSKAAAQSAAAGQDGVEGVEPRKQANTRKRRRLVRDSHEDVDEWNDEEEEEEDEETEVLASRGPVDGYPPLNLSHGANLRSSAIHTHPLDSPSDAEGSMDERSVPEHKGVAAKKPKNSKDAFKCPFCDHRSGRPNNLVIHINSKHFEENPPRTCSADPAECIGESILYFLSTKREFEEKIAILEGQVSLCSKTLQEVLGELTGEQRMNLREKAEKQQNRFLANLLG